MPEKYPNVNAANKYARSVVSGKIIACKWVKLACKRHLDDLKKEKSSRFKYRFDKGAGERVCKFIQNLPHTKGRWAQRRELIRLESWQKFCLVVLFGWLKKKDGYRRFREAYLEISRKNGKSALAAGVGLYCLAADNEFGSEVYAGATTEKQAWEVFRPAKIMAQRTPDLQSYFDIEVNAKNLAIPTDGSRFEPLIGNPGDGSSPHCAIVDEFHEHLTPDLYDTMVTGMGARDQPLAFIITTAGANLAGPCYEKRIEAQKVLEKVFEDEQLFAIIYTIDDESEWQTETGFKKANPNFGISVSKDYLRSQVKKAIQTPSKQNTVKTKHFNMWVGAREAWVNMYRWAKQADESLTIDDFKDCPCILAVDLASRVDMAALVLLFYRFEDDGKLHYYAFPIFFLPESALQTSPNADLYTGWAQQGLLKLHDEDEIDFNQIQEFILGNGETGETGLVGQYQIDEVAYDPWRATQLAQNLSANGGTVVEYRQTVANFSPAMRELEAAIDAKRFHHDGNPILKWMASNVVAKEDAKENIYPRKEEGQKHSKIDGMTALLMGIGRAMHNDEMNITDFVTNPVIA